MTPDGAKDRRAPSVSFVSRVARLALLPLLSLAAPLSGCGQSSDSGVVCGAIAAAGLSVGVTNAQTGAAICDATVTASEGSYSEKLLATACRYVGAYERPGTYVVTVDAQGFDRRAVADMRVAMGGGVCPHVQEVQLEVPLQPVP